ncbi:MAG: hypothetical protein A2Z06_03125, partial [Candidatus Glassbacteria bacterium RBG_16_58_8]
EELKTAILKIARKAGARSPEDLFRLPVDRVFTIKGMGTVVTGTIWSGSIELDDTVTILPVNRSVRVKGIQVHSEDKNRASAGSRVAMALSGISREEIERGSTALGTDDWFPSMMVDVFVTYLSRNTRPLESRTRIRFHLATQEVMGRVVLLEKKRLAEGDSGYAQIRLEKPVVTRRGDHFVVRSYSPVTTIGGGIILVPFAPKHLAADRRGLEFLETVRSGKTHEIIESVVREAGYRGYPGRRLPVDTGVGPGITGTTLEGLMRRGVILDYKGKLFHRAIAEEMRGKVLSGLETYHRENPLQRGVKREELRYRIQGVFSGDLLDGVLARLMEEGVVEVAEGEVKLASHRIVLRDSMGEMAETLLTLLSREPLSPPDLGKLSAAMGLGKGKVLELLSALQKIGRVVKVEESIWIVAEGMEMAGHRVEEYLRKNGKGSASELREFLNVSRKYAIPILEHLDRMGVTYRKGDYRYLKG